MKSYSEQAGNSDKYFLDCNASRFRQHHGSSAIFKRQVEELGLEQVIAITNEKLKSIPNSELALAVDSPFLNWLTAERGSINLEDLNHGICKAKVQGYILQKMDSLHINDAALSDYCSSNKYVDFIVVNKYLNAVKELGYEALSKKSLEILSENHENALAHLVESPFYHWCEATKIKLHCDGYWRASNTLDAMGYDKNLYAQQVKSYLNDKANALGVKDKYFDQKIDKAYTHLYSISEPLEIAGLLKAIELKGQEKIKQEYLQSISKIASGKLLLAHADVETMFSFWKPNYGLSFDALGQNAFQKVIEDLKGQTLSLGLQQDEFLNDFLATAIDSPNKVNTICQFLSAYQKPERKFYEFWKDRGFKEINAMHLQEKIKYRSDKDAIKKLLDVCDSPFFQWEYSLDSLDYYGLYNLEDLSKSTKVKSYLLEKTQNLGAIGHDIILTIHHKQKYDPVALLRAISKAEEAHRYNQERLSSEYQSDKALCEKGLIKFDDAYSN